MPVLHDVAPKITNLLSYAALVFVCFYYIAEISIKRRNPQLAKKILPLMTSATIIICLASIGSYVYLQSITTEKIIRGTVYDLNSKPLPNATVSIPGIANTETNEYGIYAIAVIPKHGEDKINTIFSKPGYETINKDISPEVREITKLAEQAIEPHKIINIMPDISIYNVVNLFGIGVKFKFNNPYSAKLKVQIYDLKISTQGKSQDLTPAASFIDIPHRKFDIPITLLEIEPNKDFTLGLRFDKPEQPSQILQNACQICLPYLQVSDFRNTGIVPIDLVDSLSSTLKEDIFWVPGNYKISISYAINDQYFNISKEFAITSDQYEAFLNASKYYQNCFGIYLSYLTSYADAAIMKIVTMK